MKRSLSKSLLISIIVGLSACTSPQLTRRYASIDTGGYGSCGTPTVTLSAFVMEPERASGPAAVGLADHGQEALLSGLAAKTGSAAELLRAVGSPALPPEERGIILERSRFKRRVVLSVASENFGPADRIQRLSLTMTLDGGEASPVRFTSWDKLATKYDSIDLGKLKLSQTSGFDAKADLVTPQINEISGIGLAYKSSKTLDEDIQLRRRLNSLSGQLQPTTARLTLEGEIGIDLTGNVAIDVELETKDPAELQVFKVTNLRQSNGTPNPPDSVVTNPRWLRIPSMPNNDLKMSVTADYVIRHVQGGAATLMEGDDHVLLVTGSTTSVPADPTLIPKPMMTFDLFALKVQSADDKKNGRYLQLMPGPTVLLFESYESALELLTWLRDSSATTVVSSIGREPINLGPKDPALTTFIPLGKEDVDHLMIDRKGANH